MRIAIFTDNTPNQVNGAAEIGRILQTVLIKNNHKLLFVSPGENHIQKNTNENVQFRSFGWKKYPECKISWLLGLKALRQLHRFDPELCILLTPFVAGISGMVYAKLYKKPSITFFLTDFSALSKYYNLGTYSSVIDKMQNYLVSISDKVFVPSEYLFKKLSLCGHNNLVKFKLFPTLSIEQNIGNKQNDEYNKFYLKEKLNILYVGRLAPDKNIGDLLKFLSNVEFANVNIVGNGPELEILKRISGRNIVYHGYKFGNELKCHYQQSDLFIMPSTEEVGGLAVIDSLSIKTPVLVFNGKATKEIVKQDVTGFFFDHLSDIPRHLYQLRKSNKLNDIKQNLNTIYFGNEWDNLGEMIDEVVLSLINNNPHDPKLLIETEITTKLRFVG